MVKRNFLLMVSLIFLMNSNINSSLFLNVSDTNGTLEGTLSSYGAKTLLDTLHKSGLARKIQDPAKLLKVICNTSFGSDGWYRICKIGLDNGFILISDDRLKDVIMDKLQESIKQNMPQKMDWVPGLAEYGLTENTSKNSPSSVKAKSSTFHGSPKSLAN